MSKLLVKKWASKLADTRNKLMKGEKQLDINVILADKKITREMLSNTLINIGHELADQLNEKDDLAEGFTKTETALIKSFNDGFNELKDKVDNNHQDQSAKLKDLQLAVNNATENIITYASVVQKSASSQGSDKVAERSIETREIKDVFKTVLSEANEKSLRSSRFIIRGLSSEEHYDPDDTEGGVVDLIETVIGHRPRVTNVTSINRNEIRPLCVQVDSPQIVHDILKNAYKLKSTRSYKTVYLAPDRSFEEQKEHGELLKKLRKKIVDDPTRWWYIRNGQMLSAELRKLEEQ